MKVKYICSKENYTDAQGVEKVAHKRIGEILSFPNKDRNGEWHKVKIYMFPNQEFAVFNKDENNQGGNNQQGGFNQQPQSQFNQPPRNQFIPIPNNGQGGFNPPPQQGGFNPPPQQGSFNPPPTSGFNSGSFGSDDDVPF